MTDAEKELKRLAQAATPGPWKHFTQTYGEWTVVGGGETTLQHAIADCRADKLTKAQNAANGEFIAATDPSAVLALLERIEALEKQAADAGLKGAKEEREKNARIVERVGFKNLASVIRAPRFGEDP